MCDIDLMSEVKMKNKVVLFSVIMIIFAAMGLLACTANTTPPDDTHVHMYTGVWHYDQDVHWHECSCGEVEYAIHSFDSDICSLCGYQKDANSTGGLSYSLNENGETYYVSDYGYCLENNVVIPSTYKGKPITEIGMGAFYGCDKIKSVVIGDNVTSIGDRAFDQCDNLTRVSIGDGVTSIGSKAFYGCTNLITLLIGEGVTYISGDAIKGCDSLRYNEYDNCQYLGNAANPYVALIKAKNNMTSVTIKENTKLIGCSAFYNCFNLVNVIIPENVVTIGANAFTNCFDLVNVIIPDNVISIGASAFENCHDLEEVVIGDSVEIIYDNAFADCVSLKSIVLPKSVKYLSDYVFYNCGILTAVFYKGTMEEWNNITLGDGTFNSGYVASTNVIFYCFSENKPTELGYYWHYVNGKPAIWSEEDTPV